MTEIQIKRLDHLVLTVQDISVTCDFYRCVLGMDVVAFGDDRKALRFGRQKINLHQAGAEFEPKARQPTPGSADLCLIAKQEIDEIIDHLSEQRIPVLEGPVERTGAEGPIMSVYFNDPDGNLIEISRPIV
jgi:catechol 2,3-dioxygenase-like lactoylglutathione lyase family enzyme